MTKLILHVREAVGNPRKGTKQDTFIPVTCATAEVSSRFKVAGKKTSCSRKAVHQEGKYFHTLSKPTVLVWFSSIFIFRETFF